MADDGKPIVWVWSTSTMPAEMKIGYMFIQEAAGKSWGDAFHVHWIDKGRLSIAFGASSAAGRTRVYEKE